MPSRLILILLGVWALLTLRYYETPSRTVSLIQTHLSSMSPSMLFDKTPIIILDRVVDINDLLSSVFKYAFLYSRACSELRSGTPLAQTFARHTLITSTSTDALIDLAHPQHPDRPVRVVMRPHQVLAVPRLWSAALAPGQDDGIRLQVTELHDSVTALMLRRLP